MISFLTPLSCPNSSLSRFDPRWKLAALSVALLSTACLQTLSAATIALFGACLLATLARVPPGAFFERFKILLPALLLFAMFLPFVATSPAGSQVRSWESEWGSIHFSSAGLHLAFLFIVKAIAIFTIALALTASTPLNTTLQAAASLRVPGRHVHLAMLTYRYLFLFAGELGRLRLALRVRGYRNRPTMHCYRTIGNVCGTLLVRSSERGERVAQAMRCRGFDGRFRSLADFRTTTMDVVGFIIIAGGFAALLAWEMIF